MKLLKIDMFNVLKRYLPSLLFIIFICYLILQADLGRDNFFMSASEKVPFGDKIGHFLIYGLLVVLLNFSFNSRRIGFRKRRIYLSVPVVLIISITEEFTQIAFESRNFDVFDILFDIVGIITFTLIYNCIMFIIRLSVAEKRILTRSLKRGLF